MLLVQMKVTFHNKRSEFWTLMKKVIEKKKKVQEGMMLKGMRLEDQRGYPRILLGRKLSKDKGS